MHLLQEKTTESTNETLASFVRRLGNPMSAILLQSPCSIFRIPHIDGIIGYKLIKNCAIVIGDPICLPQHAAELAHAFHTHCQQHNLSIIYFLTSSSFAHWAIHNECKTLIQVSEELTIDPTHLLKRQKLHWKINQSIQQGVVIKEYTNFDPQVEKQLKNSIEAWLKERKKQQIYLGDLNILDSDNLRIFYASQNENIVGLLTLSPIDRFQGWVIPYYFALSDAPVGTSEHLVSDVCDTLTHENCHFLCLGAVGGSKLGEIIGQNIVSKFFIHLIFNFSRWFFNFDAKKIYLNKYHPSIWPNYILFDRGIGFRELIALKQILNVKL